MMPYDTYRLYQAERVKSPRQIHHADAQAARLASVVPGLFRAMTHTARRPRLAAHRPARHRPHAGATTARAMEGS